MVDTNNTITGRSRTQRHSKKGTKGQYKLNQCITALQNSKGYVAKAARLLGVTYPVMSKYVKAHKVLTEIIEDFRAYRLDEAEIKLMELVREKDVQALKFYLSTQGKERGYLTESRSSVEANVKGEHTVKTYLDFAREVLVESPQNSKGGK